MEAGWRSNYLRYKSFFLNMLTQYRERSDWKAYLEILLSLATVSIFAVFALKPTIVTIAELISQIEEKKATVAKMDAKILNLSKAQNLYDRERQNISLLSNYSIPQTTNSDVFARQLEALSAKHQIAITGVTLGKALIFGKINTPTEPEPTNAPSPEIPSKTPADKLSFAITATLPIENYQNAIYFIKDFENLRMTPEIKSIELSLENKNLLTEKILVITINGNLLYLP